MLREKSAHSYISFDSATEEITVQFPVSHSVGLHSYAIESFDTVAGEVRFTDVLAVNVKAVDPCDYVQFAPSLTNVPSTLDVEIKSTLQDEIRFSVDPAEIFQYDEYFTEGACNLVEIFVVEASTTALPAPFIFEAPTAPERNYSFRVSTTDSSHIGIYSLELRARLNGYSHLSPPEIIAYAFTVRLYDCRLATFSGVTQPTTTAPAIYDYITPSLYRPESAGVVVDPIECPLRFTCETVSLAINICGSIPNYFDHVTGNLDIATKDF